MSGVRDWVRVQTSILRIPFYSIPAGDKRFIIIYQMIAMAPWAVFKPRFVQI